MKKIQSKLLSEFPQIDHYIIWKPFRFRCPFYIGEDKEIVIQDKKRLAEDIWYSQEKIVILNQTHSNAVVIINEDNYKDEIYADASITKDTDLVLCVIASDCVPILLFDPQNNTIAAIHAGREWLETGIIQKTLHIMNNTFGSQVQNIVAYIGPCISQENYELWKEVFDQFGESYNSEIIPSENKEKYLLDIKSIAKKQLLQAGIWEQKIETSKHCTYRQKNMFHSYRRKTHFWEKGYGNNLFGIALRNK